MKRILAVFVVCLLSACATDKSPVQVVKEAIAPASDKPLIEGLTPGAFVPSTLAQGEERDLAQRRSVGPGYVHAEALERYLQTIRAKLLAASGVTGVPGRVRVLADGSFSAFSTADGNVYVAMGWFDNFGNEDEIAALMAHELAHVLLKHHTSDVVSKMQKKTLSYLTYGVEAQKQFSVLVNAFNTQTGSPTPAPTNSKSSGTSTTNQSTLSKLFESASHAIPSSDASNATSKPAAGQKGGTAPTSKTEQDEKRLLRRIQWSIDVTDKAILPAWGRTQEHDADLLGVDLLVAAGYNKSAMSSMLAKLKEAEEQRVADDKSRQTQFSMVAAELKDGNWDEAAKIAFSDVLSSIAESHPPTGARIDDVDAYVIKFYAKTPLKPFNVDAWRRVKNEPTTTAFLGNYGKSFSAEQMIRKADLKVAYRLAKQGATGVTARESYTNWVAALSAEANGANGDARVYYQNAISAREPINAAYEAYVTSLERNGNYGAALVESEKASKIFGDVPSWTVTRIRLLRKSGNATAAKKLEIECGTETPDYRRACGDAGNTPLGGKGGTAKRP